VLRLIRRLDGNIQSKWIVTRRQGFWRFILARGAIVGACFAVAYLIGSRLDDVDLHLGQALAAFVVSIIVGCLVGTLVWRRHEDCYQRAAGRSAPNPPE